MRKSAFAARERAAMQQIPIRELRINAKRFLCHRGRSFL